MSSNVKDTSNAEHEDRRIQILYIRVQNLIRNAQNNIARSINAEMVNAYWLIGKAIVEKEQCGADRAEYGAKLIRMLAVKLSNDFIDILAAINGGEDVK